MKKLQILFLKGSGNLKIFFVILYWNFLHFGFGNDTFNLTSPK